MLFVILSSIVLAFLDQLVFGTDPETGERAKILDTVSQLAVLLPLLAAGCCRLHDGGRQGWYVILPTALGVVTMIALLGGVSVSSVLEGEVSDPEAL